MVYKQLFYNEIGQRKYPKQAQTGPLYKYSSENNESSSKDNELTSEDERLSLSDHKSIFILVDTQMDNRETRNVLL